MIDYKWMFARTFQDDAQRSKAYSACHKRSAERVLHALQLNGGIYIKLVCALAMNQCSYLIPNHVGPTHEQHPGSAKGVDIDYETSSGKLVSISESRY